MRKFVVLTGLVCHVATLSAQGTPALEPGSRVRVTLPCATMRAFGGEADTASCVVRGRFLATSGDTLRLHVAGSPAIYRVGAVTKLEIARASRSRVLAGAGIGAVAGAFLTYRFLYGGSTSLCDQSTNQDAAEPARCRAIVLGGGAAGAGLGALIGLGLRTTRWETVPGIRAAVGVNGRLVLGVRFGSYASPVAAALSVALAAAASGGN